MGAWDEAWGDSWGESWGDIEDGSIAGNLPCWEDGAWVAQCWAAGSWGEQATAFTPARAVNANKHVDFSGVSR